MTQKPGMLRVQQEKNSIPPNRQGKIAHTRNGRKAAMPSKATEAMEADWFGVIENQNQDNCGAQMNIHLSNPINLENLPQMNNQLVIPQNPINVGSMPLQNVNLTTLNTEVNTEATAMTAAVVPRPFPFTVEADKPFKFSGTGFRIWQQKMLFYLTTIGLANFLKEEKPTPIAANKLDQQKMIAYKQWCHGNYLCCNFILNFLVDRLYRVYCRTENAKELWEQLEKIYKTEDASNKKQAVAKYLSYLMEDGRSVVEQVREFQLIVHNVHAAGMLVPEAFTVAAMIEKLPPSWKDFKNYLRWKRKDITFEDLFVKLRIEEDNRKRRM